MSSTADARVALVLTTLEADQDAAPLALALLAERLAACITILPAMRSLYRWQGRVEDSREQQLLIKTTPDRLAALQARLRQLHPYALPEFIVLDAIASVAYAAWVGESVTDGPLDDDPHG